MGQTSPSLKGNLGSTPVSPTPQLCFCESMILRDLFSWIPMLAVWPTCLLFNCFIFPYHLIWTMLYKLKRSGRCHTLFKLTFTIQRNVSPSPLSFTHNESDTSPQWHMEHMLPALQCCCFKLILRGFNPFIFFLCC